MCCWKKSDEKEQKKVLQYHPLTNIIEMDQINIMGVNIISWSECVHQHR
jgi:hypothetical protein